MSELLLCYNKGCAQKFSPEENKEGNTSSGCHQHLQIHVDFTLVSQFSMMRRKSGLVAINTVQISRNS
ncbi:unnamed protein product [Heterobilharzia americana]|nr:unnamed protein product [Heterobilharzia americana]